MGRTLVMLQPPKTHEPCNGCGWCCRMELCGLAEEIYGKRFPAPCPAIVERDGRSWCGVVEEAARLNPAFASHYAFTLGFGVGCDADFTKSQLKVIARATKPTLGTRRSA